MADRHVWEIFDINVDHLEKVETVATYAKASSQCLWSTKVTMSNGEFSPSGGTFTRELVTGYGYAMTAVYPYCFLNGEYPSANVYKAANTEENVRWQNDGDGNGICIVKIDTSSQTLEVVQNGLLKQSCSTCYSKGATAYGYVTNVSDGEYPEDGYSGSYWYTYQGADCIDPSAVICTSPKEGEMAIVTVTPRTNIYGGVISYRYEYSVDGGSTWTVIETTTATSSTVTVPDGAETFQVRVRASDDMGFTSTDYVYADSQNVASSAGAVAVDGAIREFDVVVCVGGVVKTNVETYHGNNAVTSS